MVLQQGSVVIIPSACPVEVYFSDLLLPIAKKDS